MRASLFIAMFAVTACAEQEPSWVETEHLRVFGHADTELCAGTAPLFEREVNRLIEVLRLPEPEETIDVLVGPDAARLCQGHDGCAGRAEDGRLTAIGPYEVIPHELVHSVRLAVDLHGPSFYEEGLAVALSAGGLATQSIPAVGVGVHDVDALQLERPANASEYAIAGSFVSWLDRETDPRAFADAFAASSFDDITTREDLDAWFASAFGRSLAQAETEWVSKGPAPHVLPGPCVANDPIVAIDGHFEMAGRIDCDDPGTVGPTSPNVAEEGDIRSETRCLETDGVSGVVLTFEAPLRAYLEARLRRCDTHAISRLEFIIGGESKELAIEPEHCWLDLRVFAKEDVTADYRWTLDVTG